MLIGHDDLMGEYLEVNGFDRIQFGIQIQKICIGGIKCC
jgi:hypothetical protein